MINELDLHKQHIAKLESELDDMTAALSQAWDQLTPLLQATPEQSNSTEDIMPILESIMTGIGAHKVAVFMLETEECYSIPEGILFTKELRDRLKSLQTDSDTFQFALPTRQGKDIANWLLAPIVTENIVVGAIGVGFLET